MGLDMYLYARKYVSGYRHDDDKRTKEYTKLLKTMGVDGAFDCSAPSAEVEVTVAYWRKANSVHRWFVQNVQDGVDECQTAHVDREALADLLRVCKAVLEDPNCALAKLPTQGGFFFGSEEYGDGYKYDLTETIRQLTPLLDEGNPFEGWTFYYHSSW